MATKARIAHTPGPWVYDSGLSVIFWRGHTIARVHEIRGTQFNGMEPLPEVTAANAALIAAAPDLLAAARSGLAVVEHLAAAVQAGKLTGLQSAEWEAFAERARAAIAKARPQ